MIRIIYNIDKNGNTLLVDAEGLGSKCKSATAAIEKRLGYADESSRQDTDNLYVPVQDVNITQDGQ